MRALIVDDSRFARRHLRQLLEADGIACEEAADGAAGMAALRAGGPFDVVLVDWYMPVMNGLDMVRALRAEGFTTLKVMMVTAEYDAAAIARALEAGADEYLMKPYDAEAVRQKFSLIGLEAA